MNLGALINLVRLEHGHFREPLAVERRAKPLLRSIDHLVWNSMCQATVRHGCLALELESLISTGSASYQVLS